MAISAVCPECLAEYNLADQQQGKRVRCKHCDAVFVAGEATAQKATKPLVVEVVERPKVKPKPAAAVTARRVTPAKVTRDDEEEADESRRNQGSSILPWLIGGGVAALAIVVTGVIALVVLLRDSPTKVASTTETPKLTNPVDLPTRIEPLPLQPPGPGPVGQPVNPPPVEIKPPPPPPNDPPRNPAPAGNGKLSGEARDRVKRATVYLRVTMPDGGKAAGTGFFGSVDSRNIILTNAHVVGMLAPESRRPQRIEVFINSGERDEWKTSARVLGVDRSSDLAVLDIGIQEKATPDPLIVKSAGALRELDEVYVFGFPFGEQLGKEITIRPSSVSSLRKNASGTLARVQVNGGMDPGNSGGPVVDNTGQVVGVAVSGIPGRAINFAIPGDRVHVILNGRISALALHQPFVGAGNRIGVPVVMEMIDPRDRIKEVAVEVWSGDKPVNPRAGSRPPSDTQPPPQPGDSPHTRWNLTYRAGEGRGEITLPELPPGKIWWQQPLWTNANGQTRWASANEVRLPTQPVERKPARLALRYPARAARPLEVRIENTFKVSNDDDSDTFRMITSAEFLETVMASGPSGSTLSLRYRKVNRDLLAPGSPRRPSKLLASVKDFLPALVTTLQIDSLGNITRQSPAIQSRGRMDPNLVKAMLAFHEPIQQGLEALSVSLPAKDTVNPGESWRAERHLPIDTPGKYESGKLNVTFSYLGVRKRAGRDEAVLNIDGVVMGNRGGGDVSGKATGKVLVDLVSGKTLQADVTVVMDLDAIVTEPGEAPRKLKVIATVKVFLNRKL